MLRKRRVLSGVFLRLREVGPHHHLVGGGACYGSPARAGSFSSKTPCRSCTSRTPVLRRAFSSGVLRSPRGRPGSGPTAPLRLAALTTPLRSGLVVAARRGGSPPVALVLRRLSGHQPPRDSTLAPPPFEGRNRREVTLSVKFSIRMTQQDTSLPGNSWQKPQTLRP